jgi:NADH-quinone oxidoreductase subunit J
MLVFLTITSAVVAVTNRNVVHAALGLGFAMAGVAGFYVLLNAPFLAAAQVLVYAGAVTVLILFAVMLTAPQRIGSPRNAAWNHLVAFTAAVVLFGILWLCFQRPVWHSPMQLAGQSPDRYLDDLARALLGIYLLPFELAAVLLLAALVGAVVLAKEERQA